MTYDIGGVDGAMECTWGWGYFVIITFVIKTFFACLAVDIRLITLIAMPVLGFSVSTCLLLACIEA